MIEFLGKNKIFTDIFLHQIKPNESIEHVAFQYNISVDDLKMANEKQNFNVGKCIIIPNNKFKYHIVKPCENLESIAKLYGVSIDELKQKNRVKTLFVGQRLLI